MFLLPLKLFTMLTIRQFRYVTIYSFDVGKGHKKAQPSSFKKSYFDFYIAF